MEQIFKLVALEMNKLVFLVLMLPSLVFGQDVCEAISIGGPTTVADGAWSDPATWGGAVPGAGENAELRHAVTVTDATIGQLLVWGDLSVNGQLNASGSVVVCPGGSLAGVRGQIAFDVDDDQLSVGNTQPGPVASMPDFHPDDIGLWVVGGSVDLAGPEVTAWVDVDPAGQLTDFEYGLRRAEAISPAGTATLASIPVGWIPGDQLVITTEQGQSSQATLDAIDGRQIEFTAETALTGYALEYQGTVVVPKIGNLSRRFQVVSRQVTPGSTNHRAHVIAMGGATVNLRYVEFRNLGPRGILGRYPVHLHLLQETTAAVVGNSIWQDVAEGGNRWISIHATQGATVSGNVMFRSLGHGVFMEDRATYDNQVTGNLTVDLQHGHFNRPGRGEKEFYEEIPDILDEEIFGGTSEASNHFWTRQGNNLDDNVSVGYIDDWPGNRFPHSNGMVILPSDNPAPTTVNNYQCLGCGGFGTWSYVEQLAEFKGLLATYNRTNGWYPVLNNTQLTDSLLAMNGRSTSWAGQIFLNSSDARVINSHLVGGIGVHSHYFGSTTFEGGSINAAYPLDQSYWETVTRVNGTEITATQDLFYRRYPNLKRNSPVPVWFTGAALNGAPLDGMYVRTPEHARYFETIGSPKYSGQEVVPEQGYFLEKAVIPGLGYYGTAYYRSVTPVGEQEGQASYPYEHEAGYNASIAAGNLGYPHAFPAGQYVVRYYRSKGGELVREETVQLGDAAPPPNTPPVAMIGLSQSVFTDTDGEPGETIDLAGTAEDADGVVEIVEWLLDGELVSTLLEAQVLVSDGEHDLELHVTDDDGDTAIDAATITVEPAPVEPPEVILKEDILQILEDGFDGILDQIRAL